jgi:hypothetical protein
MSFEEIKKNIYRICNYGLPSGLFPLKERDHFKDPGVDGRMIFRKWDVETWTGIIWR